MQFIQSKEIINNFDMKLQTVTQHHNSLVKVIYILHVSSDCIVLNKATMVISSTLYNLINDLKIYKSKRIHYYMDTIIY